MKTTNAVSKSYRKVLNNLLQMDIRTHNYELLKFSKQKFGEKIIDISFRYEIVKGLLRCRWNSLSCRPKLQM